MENPLIILLLFAFLVWVIASIVNLVEKGWHMDWPLAAKAAVTLGAGLLLIGCAYFYNRVTGQIQQFMIMSGALLVSGNLVISWYRKKNRAPDKSQLLPGIFITIGISFLLYLVIYFISGYLGRFGMF